MWTREDIEALYRRHGYSVQRRCRRLLHDEEEARDMAQQVFLKALERPDAFRGQASAATYLYAVATNLCLNRIRDARARGAEWQERAAQHLRAAAPPSDPQAQTAARVAVRAALEEADEKTREIAIYHFVDGLAQGEIARLVGLSRVTVNQRLGRLRQRWQERQGETA